MDQRRILSIYIYFLGGLCLYLSLVILIALAAHRPEIRAIARDLQQAEIVEKTSWWDRDHLSVRAGNTYGLDDDPLPLPRPNPILAILHGFYTVWHQPAFSEESTLSDYLDPDFARRLALNAKQYAEKRRGQGYCLHGVRSAFMLVPNVVDDNWDTFPDDSGRYHGQSPAVSAESFRRWADANPVSLCHQLGLVDISHLPELHYKIGHVLVYRSGTCGFSGIHGHVEVVTDEKNLEGCSDHCQKIDTNCAPDLVLAPVKSCDWLYLCHGKIKGNTAPMLGEDSKVRVKDCFSLSHRSVWKKTTNVPKKRARSR